MFERALSLVLLTALTGISSACLEPNPYAESGEAGGESSAGTDTANTDTDTATDTNTDTDQPAPCDPCGLAFETLEFAADASGFVGEVPKPDQPNTAPIALIRSYDPGNASAMGYSVSWTELDAAWELRVELIEPTNNASVSGLAVVIGTQAELDSELLELSEGGCAQPSVSGAVVVEGVERYLPAAGEVLNFSRDAQAEYCASGDDPSASVAVRVLAFDPGEGPIVSDPAEALLNSGGSRVLGFEQLPASAEVVHLIGARSFDETSATNLGYAVDCDTGALPYPCEFDLISFKGGAEAAFGGVTVAIP